MYEIERLPGPCVMCGLCVVELKRIPGQFADGVCERCDEVRFNLLRSSVDDEFVCWEKQKEQIALRRSKFFETARSSLLARQRVPA